MGVASWVWFVGFCLIRVRLKTRSENNSHFLEYANFDRGWRLFLFHQASTHFEYKSEIHKNVAREYSNDQARAFMYLSVTLQLFNGLLCSEYFHPEFFGN